MDSQYLSLAASRPSWHKIVSFKFFNHNTTSLPLGIVSFADHTCVARILFVDLFRLLTVVEVVVVGLSRSLGGEVITMVRLSASRC